MFGCVISINISPLAGLESLKLIREEMVHFPPFPKETPLNSPFPKGGSRGIFGRQKSKLLPQLQTMLIFLLSFSQVACLFE